MRPRRSGSSAWPLSAAFALLIVYASLYPFTGWRIPPLDGPLALLRLPWLTVIYPFDLFSNIVGYLPLGLLLYGGWVRSGGRWPGALLLAVGASGALSYTMEVTQYLLPDRVPSLLDWVTNVGGALIGALIAMSVKAMGYVERWQGMRDRWVIRRSGGALALLLLWPIGLLFPPPVPFGLGPPWERLIELVDAAIDGVPWLDALGARIAERVPPVEMKPASEWLAITFGLLAPMLVAYAVSRPGWRRPMLALGALAVGFLAATLSTALNFGPTHAFGWIAMSVWPAVAGALFVALILAPASQRIAAAVGLIVLSALTVLIAQAPSDPYFAQSLQAWEQGRFIRFHGIAQWVGWLWPLAAIAWLLARVGSRDE